MNVEIFRRDAGWYPDLDIAEYFQPTASDVLKIDTGLGTYLKEVANRKETKWSSTVMPHWKDNILEIRARQKEYAGQFVGVRTRDGTSVILAFYSHMEACDLDAECLANIPVVPWGADTGGRNFRFQYDGAEERLYGLHVNGRQPGPFGCLPILLPENSRDNDG